MKLSNEKIRSVAMLNPCLNLQAHLEKERENMFFYKRLTKEIANAYEIDSKRLKTAVLNQASTAQTSPFIYGRE
ncbi:hypothetical protein MGI18_07120 [Bacillus sp. OVS6]|nr:hypothetical protein MGI18_07120 [Bacillus sp. OVS6]